MKISAVYIVRFGRILFLGVLVTLLITNCSEEPLCDEVQYEQELKSSGIMPEYQEGEFFHYQGLINNDSIEIVIPENWNRSFIVYAHGYVDPIRPIALPQDVIGLTPLKQLIVGSGFGYATTSYSENGFAVKEGVTDIKFLGNMLKAQYKPLKLYLGGVSEGGLVALKMLERNQHIFDAGLIACGPIGDFNKQLQYFGDFHVLFNYFYSEELNNLGIDIGNPSYVSPAVMQAWSNGDLDLPLLTIIGMQPWKLPALLHIAKVPVDGIPPQNYTLLVKEILRFNIMATNDMIERVHGVPFDNINRNYEGVLPFPVDYAHLNNNVMRISGDKQAMHRVELLFETTGSPNVPVVFMHTEGDHVTPLWHLNAFMNKTDPLRTDLVYYTYPVPGHCNFNVDQIQAGISTMVALSD